jgi:hypothetical protein
MPEQSSAFLDGDAGKAEAITEVRREAALRMRRDNVPYIRFRQHRPLRAGRPRRPRAKLERGPDYTVRTGSSRSETIGTEQICGALASRPPRQRAGWGKVITVSPEQIFDTR